MKVRLIRPAPRTNFRLWHLTDIRVRSADVIPKAIRQSWQRGYRWTASSREHSVAPLTGVAGRVERALRNYLETFPFFAAAILVITVTNTHNWLTVWGAHFYFWGRIVYAILYMVDLPLARSLVWNIPTIGIPMNVAGLFLK